MLTAEPVESPRMPNQHPDIMPGSPSAILAVFTEIVRERFRPGNNLSWVWDGVATPDPAAAATVSSARRILIEPAYSETSEARNVRPAIYIDRGPTAAGKVSVGNLAGQHVPTGMRAFYAMAQIPIIIQVEASRKGESTVLADAVWFHMLGSIEQVRRTFDLQDITLPQLGTTSVVEKDKTGWVTPVSFAITTNLRWTTTPIGDDALRARLQLGESIVVR